MGPNALKLKQLVRHAVVEHHRLKDGEIARLFREENSAVIEAWIEESLTGLVAGERQRRERAEDPFQMFLPGFQSLEYRLPMKHGSTELRKSTMVDLRQALDFAKKRRAARVKGKGKDVERLEKLIEAMKPYARKHRGLTVERYCELAAAESVSSEKPEYKNAKAKR
jgi:hypothetical protein